MAEQDHEDEDQLLINNRQTGRRRGRGGGPRPPNAGNQRQDQRSRGNASQLLEKYKSLARDAQLQGDRVQSEYFLQFSDHYYRVLNENRARFEEQRRQRDDYYSDEEEDQDEAAQAAEHEERDERHDREARSDRGDRGDRGDGRGRDRSRRDYRDRDERNGQRPRRFEERSGAGEEEETEERIALDVLPPSIAPASDEEAPAKAPRRRSRRPRDESGEADLPPAA